MKIFYLILTLFAGLFGPGQSFLFGPVNEHQSTACPTVDEDVFSQMSSKTDYALYADTNNVSDDFTMPGMQLF
jgi:hypothetical protein